MEFAVVQGCPVPKKLAPFLRVILLDSGAHLQSAYRGSDPKGVALLHRLGKSSQAELYRGYKLGRPGYNPANRPGTSTHELLSDGRAYPRVPIGHKLPWWACGLDVDDVHVHAFIRAAARHGWKVVQPYPVGSEYHHVNFRKPPLWHRVRAAVRR